MSASGPERRVLSIGKLGSSRKQLEYYERQVAAGIEDYYAGRGEAPGRWRGSGTQALGLGPGARVEREAFLALMRGRNPVDGSVLRAIGACSTVAALDLTFSAPKSVSVLFAIAEGDVPAALVEAHKRAVDAALGYLEREACWTRRGHAGSQQLRGEGFVAAAYRHRLSRAGDPQLHTHVVVANMTCAEGRFTALDAHALYEHKSAAGALYRAVLRAEVRERLPWVSWRAAGRGLFEIDGVPEKVVRHFSLRRAEIEERAAELTGGGARGLSRERMQGIALATRRAKSYDVDGPTWRQAARARAAEHGLGAAELAALVEDAPVADDSPDLAELFAHLSGAEGLTGMHNTFARRHALAEIAGAFVQGTSAPRLDEVTESYLADPSVHPLAADGEERYTTVGLLACERRILDSAARRAHDQVGVLAGDMVDHALAVSETALNEDQAAAVRAITSSGRGIDVVEALAGTGKTTMIGALASCYRLTGWTVVGAAPTARAARQLREAAQIPATTMHSLLGELERSRGFLLRTVLVIDEAGMAPTRTTSRLFEHAERAGVKVIAIGDSGQLGPVEAGGWLANLSRRQPRPVLRRVVRQQDPRERAALEALHDGHPDRYLAHKQNAITIHTTEGDALSAVVLGWEAARREHGIAGAVMIARDNATRQRLNHAARQQLKHDRALAIHDTIIGDREYAVGDRVIARRNSRHLNVDNGMIATVIEIDSSANRMRIQTDSGETRELDLAYVAAHVEHAYALTGHGAQGATVTWAGVVGRPREFTREWAYTALSRARDETTIHIIGQPDPGSGQLHPQQATPQGGAVATLRSLRHAMKRREAEPLAIDQTRAGSIHHVARTRDTGQRELDRLAELDLRRSLARSNPSPSARSKPRPRIRVPADVPTLGR